MHPIRADPLSAEQHAELDHANRTGKDGRLRIRALIVLLAAKHGRSPPTSQPSYGCTRRRSRAG
jgi:hypothetical protein